MRPLDPAVTVSSYEVTGRRCVATHVVGSRVSRRENCESLITTQTEVQRHGGARLDDVQNWRPVDGRRNPLDAVVTVTDAEYSAWSPLWSRTIPFTEATPMAFAEHVRLVFGDGEGPISLAVTAVERISEGDGARVIRDRRAGHVEREEWPVDTVVGVALNVPVGSTCIVEMRIAGALTPDVVAPAFDRVVVAHRTAVCDARTDVPEPCGSGPVCRRLAEVVPPPALDLAVVTQCAVVKATRADLCELSLGGDLVGGA